MKSLRLTLLFVSVAALSAEPTLFGQPVSPSTTPPTGIEIVPSLKKPTNAREPAEKELGGYLLVYFKDATHSAYFALSRDGYSFTDVNGGKPVFNGAEIAEQKGVRDPHIARGPDGAFYLSMTDLHVNGQRAGFRTTQWERPEPQYGWGNNRALVLMKSYDLIHWTHADFRIDRAFPEFADVGCIWAPQTIYDAKKGKMMIYFTAKIGRGVDDLYYAYTDDAFTKIETKPERYFWFPYPDGPLSDDVRNQHHVIDGDITKVGDTFHLFYSSKENGTPGIEHSASKTINAGYPVVQKRVDPETFSCEAPNVFKRLGTETYVLMYDAYGAPGGGNMGFAETTDFATFKNIGLFNAGAMKGTNFDRPKHGAVMHLTLAELKAAAAHWKIDLRLD